MKQTAEWERKLSKERCRICQKTYEFSVSNFRWCGSCEDYYCIHCVKTCDLCRRRDLCVICAEKVQDEFGMKIPLHLCRKCAESISKDGKGDE